MRIPSWGYPLLLLCMAANPASAQILHYSTESREVYAHMALPCDSEKEDRAVPRAPFAHFDSSAVVRVSGCPFAAGEARQISTLLGDFIDIRGGAGLTLTSPGNAIMRSDASITFHLESGRWYSYDLDVLCQSSSNFGSGVAVAGFSLDLLGSSGGTVEVFVARTDPNRDQDVRGTTHHGILQSGDYVLEAHASAEATSSADLWSSVRLQMRFYLIPTAVLASSWGQVKALYH